MKHERYKEFAGEDWESPPARGRGLKHERYKEFAGEDWESPPARGRGLKPQPSRAGSP